jgi:hypothetical protein
MSLYKRGDVLSRAPTRATHACTLVIGSNGPEGGLTGFIYVPRTRKNLRQLVGELVEG